MHIILDMNKWYCFQNFVLAFIGAFTLYYQMLGTGKYVLCIIPRINPNLKNNPWFAFLESILVSLIGSVLAVCITQPATIPQAVVAGLGWSGIVNGNYKGDK